MSESHRSILRVVGTIAAAALLMTSLGCVTKGKYNELAAKQEKTRSERDALVEYTRALEDRLEEINASRDLLAAQLAVTEVQTGQIEIQQLVDGIRLAVSDELLFPSGSADLNQKGRDLLIRVAGQISDEEAIIAVEGHTDDVGIGPALRKRYATNWELAAARAAGVVRILNENGIAGERIRAVSRGPFSPVASNETEQGRAKNRRTEILLRPVPGG
jgi:chemotaxis protein MotB